MVVAHDRCNTNARADKVVTHHSLKASLSRLKVITSDEGVVLSRILNNSGVESILRGAIQISDTFLDRSDTVKN